MSLSTAQRRLLQEYRNLTNDPPDGITAGPVSEDDMFHWEALIEGPQGTPFEGGIFPAELKFPKDYPLAPPKMTFLGEIFHPNGKPPGTHSIIQRLTSRQSTRAATSAFPSSILPKKTNTATRKPASAGHPSFHPRLSFYRSSVCSEAQTMKVPPTSRPASSGERTRKSSRGR